MINFQENCDISRENLIYKNNFNESENIPI
jgi:hypothetical protein